MFYTSPAATVSVNANTNSVQVTGFDLSPVLAGMLLFLGARDRVTGDGYIIASVTRTGTSGGTITTLGPIPTAYTNAAFVIDTTGYNGSASDLLIKQFVEIQSALSLLTGAGTNLYSGSKQVALDKDNPSALSRLLYAIKGRNWFGSGQRTIPFAGAQLEGWAVQAFPDGTTPVDAITVNGSNGAVDFRSEESIIPSATITDIGAPNTRRVLITGTTKINSFGDRKNCERILRFSNVLILTHSADIQLPAGAANIVTAAGDTCFAVSDAAGKWVVLNYQRFTGGPLLGTAPVLPEQPTGRLTLTSGVAVTTTDVMAATSVFYTPAGGNLLYLYDGSSAWKPFTFGDLRLDLSTAYHGAGGTYDLFVYNDGGTLRLGTGSAWQGIAARGTGANTTELQSIAGMLVNKVALTFRHGAAEGNIIAAPPGTALYVGTIYLEANGQVHDAKAYRHLFNAYNRELRPLLVTDPAFIWTYSTALWRQANGNGFNRLRVCCGLPAVYVEVEAIATLQTTGAEVAAPYTGIGINRSDINHGENDFVGVSSATTSTLKSRYRGHLGMGNNDIYWLEYALGDPNRTQTWFGTNNGSTNYFTGLRGVVVL